MGTRRRRVSVIHFISKLDKWDDPGMANISNSTQVEINKAAQALKDGHLVAFPTETVYGLGADATNEKAVRRVYSVKARPTDHPLIIHVSSINQLGKWAIDIPEYAIRLAEEFWPGPMTLILQRGVVAKDFVTGGQENIGVRVPAHPVALGILSEFEKYGGFGIAAPSANRFGAVSPTNAHAVKEELGSYLQASDLILNGGQSFVGIESTIINCTGDYPTILRPGAVTTEMIEGIKGFKAPMCISGSTVKASGSFQSHYSPRAKVLLDVNPEPGDGFIAMSDLPTPKGAIRLANPGDVEQYARDFYMALREGDRRHLKKITIVQPNGGGLATAIRDRCMRAAAGD